MKRFIKDYENFLLNEGIFNSSDDNKIVKKLINNIEDINDIKIDFEKNIKFTYENEKFNIKRNMFSLEYELYMNDFEVEASKTLINKLVNLLKTEEQFKSKEEKFRNKHSDIIEFIENDFLKKHYIIEDLKNNILTVKINKFTEPINMSNIYSKFTLDLNKKNLIVYYSYPEFHNYEKYEISLTDEELYELKKIKEDLEKEKQQEQEKEINKKEIKKKFINK